LEHPYRRKKSCFNGQEENREAPLPIKSEYTIQNGQKQMLFIRSGGIFGCRNDPVDENGVK